MTHGIEHHSPARLIASFLLLGILITPYIVAAQPTTSSPNGATQLPSELGTSLPKIDPDLKQLMDRQKSGNAETIVVFKHDVDSGLIEKIIEEEPSFRVITRFEIIPAVLIEGPINKISGLFSIREIRGIYLNQELNVDPINKTLSPLSSAAPASPWIEAINTAPVRSITDGSGVKVAVVDSGIDDNHPDLAGKVLERKSFVNTQYGYPDNESLVDDFGVSIDYFGHGTYVSGIIAGGGVLASTYEGVAPGVKLINAKFIDSYGRGYSAGLVSAIEWAVNQSVDVINLSVGGGSADPDDPVSLAVDGAVRSGVVVVSSAGNSGPYYSSGESPGAARLGISVGASNGTDSVASFSSRGPTLDGRVYPDVLAPGADIVSTLASRSAIADYTIRLGQSTGDYVQLDGTSAAAPLVSGSVALILSVLTQLNRSVVPDASKIGIATAIKIALMRTANRSIGADINTQGAGLIDVGSAYEYLAEFGNTGYYPILDVYPNTLFSAPDFVGFLGDSLALNLSLLTAFKANLSVALSGNASSFIKLRNSTFENVVGLTPIDVEVSVPVNATLGEYSAQIGFVNTTSPTNQLIPDENVTVSFSVRSPKGSLYFDLFHSESTFSTRSALYKFASAMFNQSYRVFEGNVPITYADVSQYDILVLVDPVIMFGVEEVNAIEEFVEKNGSLLILGNYYPSIVAESVNEIIAKYGMRCMPDLVAYYTDMVTGKILTSMINATGLASHPIMSGVDEYLFGFGSSLSVNSSIATSVASVSFEGSSLSVLAACNSSETGRIVVSGSILFATDDSLLDKSYPGNLELTQNIINWLLNDETVSVEVKTNETRVRTGEPFQVGMVVFNGASGSPIPAAVTCTAYNGSSTVTINLSNKTNGIFYNMSVVFYSEGFYMFTADISYGGYSTSKEFSVEVVDSPPVISNVTLTTYNDPLFKHLLPADYRSIIGSNTPLILRHGDYVNFTISVSGLSAGPSDSNVTVYLSRYPLLYISNNKPLTYVPLAASRINATTYSAQYKPTLGNNTDIYLFWVSANNLGHLSRYNEVNMIMVASIDPVIDNVTSTVNSQSLSSLNPQYYMTFKTGETISVAINGSDPLEELTSDMRAWAMLFDMGLYRVTGFSGAELIISELQYDSASLTFTGDLTIPSSGLVDYVFEDRVLGLVQYILSDGATPGLLLVFLLVDSDGAYSLVARYVWILRATETPVLLVLTILLASVAIPVLIIVIIEKKARRKVEAGPQPDQIAVP